MTDAPLLRLQGRIPTHPGIWWVALDDGERIVEVSLVNVRYYRGFQSFEPHGADCFFVADPERRFTMKSIDQAIVQPGRTVALGVLTHSPEDEVRITWLQEVRPPRGAPKVGDRLSPAERTS